MNEVFENIKKRRSVRKFKKDVLITHEQIETLLRMAMQAPSARNQQAWEFMVIDDRKILDQMAQLFPFCKILETAPLAIMVLANQERITSPLYPQDLASATQNILLGATAQGIGSCWLGVHLNSNRFNSLIEFFKLPSKNIPFSIVALGVPEDDDSLIFIDRYQPNYIFYNRR